MAMLVILEALLFPIQQTHTPHIQPMRKPVVLLVLSVISILCLAGLGGILMAGRIADRTCASLDRIFADFGSRVTLSSQEISVAIKAQPPPTQLQIQVVPVPVPVYLPGSSQGMIKNPSPVADFKPQENHFGSTNYQPKETKPFEGIKPVLPEEPTVNLDR